MVIRNQAPVAQAITGASTHWSTAINIDTKPFVSDPNGDAVTVSSVSYAGADAIVSIAQDQTMIVFSPLSSINLGALTFTYTITDGAFTASESVTVDVVDQAPVAGIIEAGQVLLDAAPQCFDASTVCSDADGDNVFISSISSSVVGQVSLSTDPVSANPCILFQATAVGSDSISFTCSDSKLTAIGTFNVEVLAPAPVAESSPAQPVVPVESAPAQPETSPVPVPEETLPVAESSSNNVPLESVPQTQNSETSPTAPVESEQPAQESVASSSAPEVPSSSPVSHVSPVTSEPAAAQSIVSAQDSIAPISSSSISINGANEIAAINTNTGALIGGVAGGVGGIVAVIAGVLLAAAVIAIITKKVATRAAVNKKWNAPAPAELADVVV